MPYNKDPNNVTLKFPENNNVTDYHNANPGQWFYGVLDTVSGDTWLVAGNVHDEPRNATQENPRMLNTYASKATPPGGGFLSLSGKEQIDGIIGEPTGHARVCELYGLSAAMADMRLLGYRLIKINTTFGTLSDRSNSLNADKTDQRVVESTPGPNGYKVSTTARMPEQWRDKLADFIKTGLQVTNLAIDN